ncbi:MAG: T9SS type A sorting domain-containing protein [Candidatus Krumholzibacteriia bacterium]
MLRPCNHLLRSAILVVLSALVLAPAARAEYLGNITFDKELSSFLPHGEHVTVSVDYKIDDPAGRRIYVVPYANGSPAPGYGVSGSAVYPAGIGTATPYFTILSGEVLVDEVRVYTRDPDFTTTPLEIFVPAAFQFGARGVFNIQPSTTPYGQLPHGTNLSVTFDYAVDAPSCRIYARPWSGSHQPGGYSASGSGVLPPSGSSVQSFSFAADAEISHIRFLVYSGDGSTLLDEFLYPFPCRWSEWGLYDIQFDHDSTTSLHNSQNLLSSFTFDHQDPAGLRVWTWSIQDGGYCPGSVYQGSILEPAGAHSVTRYTRVSTGTEVVDHIRFLIGTTTEIYSEFDVPLHVTYGPHAVQNIAFSPGAPAILSYGERLDMTFDYVTDEAAGVRVYGRGAYNETPLFGMTSAGSPLYPAPSGSGDFWLTYDGDTTANSIRFTMVSADQSQTFLNWFEPGWFIWAGSGSVTDVDLAPVATGLGQGYPNPFNPTATIPVKLARSCQATLAVYDVKGRLVRTLHDGILAAGEHTFTFDGTGLGSGTYLYRLQTPDGVETRRLMLVK